MVGLSSGVNVAGSIRLAHTAAEYVPTDEVETMARVFERLLESA